MSVREEFEKWVESGNWMYIDSKIDAFIIWQAAYAAGQESMRDKLDQQWNAGFDAGKAAGRAATIEECAKVCESQSNDWASSSAWESSHAARDCAAAIRSLKAG